MKVKLKNENERMERCDGLFRKKLKALNRGEIIEIDEIPEGAKPFLVEVGNKSNSKNKAKGDK